MSIVLNGQLVINEDSHIWNTSVKAIEGSALRQSARIVKHEGDVQVVLRHTWQVWVHRKPTLLYLIL